MTVIDWIQTGLIAGLTVALVTSQLAVWRHFRAHDANEREELEAVERLLASQPPRWEED